MFGYKKIGSKKVLGLNDFWAEQKMGPHKFRTLNYLGQNKFEVQKILGPKKITGPINFGVSENIWVPKDLGSKKCWPEIALH